MDPSKQIEVGSRYHAVGGTVLGSTGREGRAGGEGRGGEGRGEGRGLPPVYRYTGRGGRGGEGRGGEGTRGVNTRTLVYCTVILVRYYNSKI